MKTIKNWSDFLNEKKVEITEVQKEVRKEEVEIKKTNYREHYQKFFHEKLKKFGAKNISSLGDKRGEFFKEIKAEWSKHKETIK